jgi:hypothetical protein
MVHVPRIKYSLPAALLNELSIVVSSRITGILVMQ